MGDYRSGDGRFAIRNAVSEETGLCEAGTFGRGNRLQWRWKEEVGRKSRRAVEQCGSDNQSPAACSPTGSIGLTPILGATHLDLCWSRRELCHANSLARPLARLVRDCRDGGLCPPQAAKGRAVPSHGARCGADSIGGECPLPGFTQSADLEPCQGGGMHFRPRARERQRTFTKSAGER